MKKDTLFVGLDVHAELIYIALAEAGRRGDARSFGRFENKKSEIQKVFKKLKKKYELQVCYEAGPTGYGLYWTLTEMGIACEVIAPTLIPKRSGDKVKTDRKDALKLAHFYRSGELTAVWVPDRAHEALRDLVRGREAAKGDLRAARHRLGKLLLRYGISRPSTMKKNWSLKHMLWIKTLWFSEQSLQMVFLDYLHEVEHQHNRLKALESAIDRAVEESPEHIREVVAALQLLRGVAKITAVGVVAEIGNFSRFDNPSKLMSYAGLVPSEYSSGGPGNKKQGGITKTGNSHVRRLMTESGWSYRFQPALNTRIQKCQDEIRPELLGEIKEVAWKAQRRLCGKYQAMTRAGKVPTVAVTAVARELLGFIWSIAVYVETHQSQSKRIAA